MSNLVGKHTAKVLDYGISLSKNGDPQALVTFSFLTDGVANTLTWFGGFKPSAIPGKKGQLDITVETLVKLGLQGEADVLAEGPRSNALNTTQDYEIQVDTEEYNGKTYTKVKYVNLPGESNIDRIDRGQAVLKLQGLNIGGMVAQQNAEMQASAPTPPAPQAQTFQNNYGQQAPLTTVDGGDLPF